MLHSQKVIMLQRIKILNLGLGPNVTLTKRNTAAEYLNADFGSETKCYIHKSNIVAEYLNTDFGPETKHYTHKK